MADLGGNQNVRPNVLKWGDNGKNTESLIIVHVDGRCKLKMRAVFCDINRCKLSVKNAILCLEYGRL